MGGDALHPEAGSSDKLSSSCCPWPAVPNLLLSPTCWPMPHCSHLTRCCPAHLSQDGWVPPAFSSSSPSHSQGTAVTMETGPAMVTMETPSGAQVGDAQALGGAARRLSPPPTAQEKEHDPDPGKTSKTQASVAAEMQKHHTSLHPLSCATRSSAKTGKIS